jgi:hypothetical protein
MVMIKFLIEILCIHLGSSFDAFRQNYYQDERIEKSCR